MIIQENQTVEYYRGVYDSIREYAHWKEGKQHVGTCGKLLSKAIEEINEIMKRSSQID